MYIILFFLGFILQLICKLKKTKWKKSYKKGILIIFEEEVYVPFVIGGTPPFPMGGLTVEWDLKKTAIVNMLRFWSFEEMWAAFSRSRGWPYMCQDTKGKHCSFRLMVWNIGVLKSIYSVKKLFEHVKAHF